MEWFLTCATALRTNQVHTANTNNQQSFRETNESELKLFNQLTPQLRQFYALESRAQHPFEELISETQMEEYNVFRKDPANSEKEVSQMNCANHQLRYLQCLAADKSSQLKKCSEDSKTVDKCLAFQKQLFYKLGLRYTKDTKKFAKITETADKLSIKWLDRVKSTDQGLDDVVLKEVYDARDYIWSGKD